MTLPPVLTWLAFAIVAAAAAPSSADALLRAGDVPAALAAATEAARAAPADVAAQELYLDLLVATGQRARAEREAHARVTAAPEDPDAHYLLGRAAGDPGAAQAEYEVALRFDPDHARAHMGMGAVHEGRGRLALAATAYGNAVARDRSLGEAWLGLARVHLREGRNAPALEVARQGLAAVPDEPGLALLVARLAPQEAERVLTAALARVPGEPRLHAALAVARLDAGETDAALADARAALAIDPTAEDALRVELVALELRDARLSVAGRRELEALGAVAAAQSLPRYDALVQAHPRSALVLLGRSAARRATGDAQGHLDDLVAAIQLDPLNVEAQGACGLALLQAGRAAEAGPLLSAASTARPWDVPLGLARVRALRDTGSVADADRLLGQFASLHRFDPAVQAAWGAALATAGRTEEAYVVVKAALLATPEPTLAALFVQLAPAAGHPQEAAALLDQIVAATGNPTLAEAARKLRAGP